LRQRLGAPKVALARRWNLMANTPQGSFSSAITAWMCAAQRTRTVAHLEQSYSHRSHGQTGRPSLLQPRSCAPLTGSLTSHAPRTAVEDAPKMRCTLAMLPRAHGTQLMARLGGSEAQRTTSRMATTMRIATWICGTTLQMRTV